jgi:hypothetical protein
MSKVMMQAPSPSHTHVMSRTGVTIVADEEGKVIVDSLDVVTLAGEGFSVIGPYDEAAAGVPLNVDVPYASQEGMQLTCTMGNWENEPTSYSYQWMQGETMVGTNSATYDIQEADVGVAMTCLVTAMNDAGGATAPPSNEVVPSATPPVTGGDPTEAPVNTAAPVVAQVAAQLTCTTGTWDNTPTTYNYAWMQDGTTAVGTNVDTYDVQAGDEGRVMNCTVTAVNAIGEASAPSNDVTVTA